jgi:hypothetical protein
MELPAFEFHLFLIELIFNDIRASLNTATTLLLIPLVLIINLAHTD